MNIRYPIYEGVYRILTFEQFRSHEAGTVAFRNGYEPEAETLS